VGEGFLRKGFKCLLKLKTMAKKKEKGGKNPVVARDTREVW